METVSAQQVKSRLNGSQDAIQRAHPAYLDRLSEEASALAQLVSGRLPLVLDVSPTSQHASQVSTEMQELADAHVQLDRQCRHGEQDARLVYNRIATVLRDM
jgi:hypothetical protein